MAEDTDNTQKPKAELIKRTSSPAETGDHEGADAASKQEHGGRRKVIVVKKKSPAPPAPPAPANAGGKRIQPKAVVAKGATQEGDGDTEPRVNNAAAPAAASEPPADAAKTQAKNDAAPVAETQAENTTDKPPAQAETQEKPVKKEGAGTFTLSQRPIAAAGRVGGKYVGPRPSHEEPVRGSSSPHRPNGAAGRVGGRPVGPRDSNEHGRSGDNTRHGDHARSGEHGRPGEHGRYGGPPRQGGFGGQPRQGGFSGPPRQGGFGGQNRGGPNQQNRGPGGFNRGPGSRPGGPNQGGFGGNRPFGSGGPGRGNFGQSGGTGTPPPQIDGKGAAKKSFKAKKPVYTRKDKEQEMEEKLLQTKKKIMQVANPVPKSIEIMEVISVSELAKKMNLRASDLIQKLMSMGQMVTINQQIDSDTATILAAEFGADVKVVSLYDETLIETGEDDDADMTPRPPLVTVMGHVDHGKTKLLDAIRSTNVVSGEFGGITQHIGAYTVDTANGKIAFLDTPGHEAFTRMRARGAQVTDIVVLVVAADDGVMPQTIEALNHAREAGVPIIVALNKIDKPEANPDRVKKQLSDHQLVPEEWGGQTMFVEISALKKEGIDKLIDSILLQAEILDLKANYNRAAEGKILESRIDHGRGIVATVMIERGTLYIGDSFVAGVWPGKVRALFTDKGEKVDHATPAMPIEVLGFEGIPNAGDPLQVVSDEKTARGISVKRQELKRFEDSKNIKKITLDNLHDTINQGAIQELKVIIKADVQGSAEAMRSSLENLSTREVRLHVIQALPGAINEGDVDLAIASNAIIIGFNVRPVAKAKLIADQEKVDIRRYNIIYKAVEEVRQAMEGMLAPDTKEEIIATVEVRDTFKTPKFGTIAGCYVLTGNVKRSASVHVIRDSIEVHSGKLGSLRRFKDDVREVAQGFECGIGIEDFDDVKEGDLLEIFEIVQVARKLTPSK